MIGIANRQEGHWINVGWNRKDAANICFLIKTDPSHRQPFSTSRQPHILNGTRRRQDIRFRYRVPPENVITPPGRIAGHTNGQWGFPQCLHFETEKKILPVVFIVNRESTAFLVSSLRQALFHFLVCN